MTGLAVWATAIALCVAAAVLEGIFAGKDPLSKLRSLRQPRWSPPIWLWIVIGLLWYAACLTGLVRLLPLYDAHQLPVILLIAMMLANAVGNLLLFRMRHFDWAFLFMLLYVVLAAGFIWSASDVDRVTTLVFVGYFAYLPYAAAWIFRLWRLNR